VRLTAAASVEVEDMATSGTVSNESQVVSNRKNNDGAAIFDPVRRTAGTGLGNRWSAIACEWMCVGKKKEDDFYGKGLRTLVAQGK